MCLTEPNSTIKPIYSLRLPGYSFIRLNLVQLSKYTKFVELISELKTKFTIQMRVGFRFWSAQYPNYPHQTEPGPTIHGMVCLLLFFFSWSSSGSSQMWRRGVMHIMRKVNLEPYLVGNKPSKIFWAFVCCLMGPI